ncbi:hypothetical protein ACYAFX_07030 [Rhodococcus aetherivorans]
MAALVAAGALLAPPFVSDDPVLLGPGVLDATTATAIGSLAAAVAVVLTATWALVTGSPAAATGLVAGAGLGALGILGPRLAAGLTGERLAPSPGAAVGVVAAVALVAAAVALPRLVARSARAAGPVPRAVTSVPAMLRRHVTAGVAGIATGVVATAGALLPTLSVPAGAGARPAGHSSAARRGPARTSAERVAAALEFAALCGPPSRCRSSRWSPPPGRCCSPGCSPRTCRASAPGRARGWPAPRSWGRR